MTRYFLADFRTGKQILDLNVMEGPWSDQLNSPESIMVKIDMRDPDMIALNLRSSSAKGKTLLGCAEGDQIMALGPIWARDWDSDARTLQLNALGVWSYFDHRHIIPLVAMTHPVDDFTAAAVNTNLTALSLGTIAKKWVQQSWAWTGGDIPLVYQDDEAGGHERNVTGIEFENLGEALRKLTKVENGPDIKFQGRFTDDGLGVEFLLQTGTEAQPMISSASIHTWDFSAPESSVSNFHAVEDGSKMASIAWATGGRSGDELLVSRAVDMALVDAGHPLMETLDSSHSSVEQQGTLDSYTSEAVLFGRYGSEIWSFDVDAHSQPIIGSYRPGDYCKLTVAKYDPVTGIGDPYIPGGTYDHRIIGIDGDHKGNIVHVQCAPVRSV